MPCRLLFLVSACFLVACSAVRPASPEPVPLLLAGERYQVVIADDPSSRARGLMFVPALPDDHGMLFIMPNEEVQRMWMRNTFIPLDVLFFDSDQKLVSQLQGVPPCPAMPCPHYSSGVPARYMLEVNAGQAARLGLVLGQRFELPRR